jgi:hypothetical protein
VHFIQFEVAVSADFSGLVQRKLGQNLSVFLALTGWNDPPLADGSSSRCILRLIEDLLGVDSIIYALAHPLIRDGRHVAIVLVLWLRLQSVIGLLLLGVLVQGIIPVGILLKVERSQMRESHRVVEVVGIFLNWILKIPLAVH